ncbi:hypothetical protein K7A42_23890 [Agrobacterium sp. InxBP2]|uniref:hypothetical protein n=1 Tax=Agrobacterium sp. InxBP2 TaxID=2870329 RepID=UPI00249E474A|nr:hypothetical protein [Agrobacterium sp. InxBP2]MCW8283950.1 hypothetical protein [Agrobacterium sp. InxBP2]
MTAPYTAGTIDLVSGSSAVVGTDTAWEVSLIIGGTIYVEFDGGNPMPIATVDSDTVITAALKWAGPTGTYSYAIVRDTAYGQQTVANAQALATYIQRLNNPALAATAGVTPGSNKLLLFTGANSATVIDLEDLLQGVKFDEEVPTLADRAAYDGEAEGFRVLVANIGDGRSAFYTKKSAAAGDWTVPFYITGPVGGAGPYTDITIGPTETLPAGSDAEVTLVPVSPGVIRLDFGLPKGEDGTGTGDFSGPAGGVASGDIVAFGDTTGKTGRKATQAELKAAIGGLPVAGYISPSFNLSNNAADATNDLDFPAGIVASEQASPILMNHAAVAGMQLDIAWGVGNGARFDAAISDGWWHCFIISNGTLVSRGLSKSLNPTTQPNYPAGFTHYRRVASWPRLSGVLLQIRQRDDVFELVTSIQVRNSTAAQASTLLQVPTPDGIVTQPILSMIQEQGAQGNVQTGVASAGKTPPSQIITTLSGDVKNFTIYNGIYTNTSSQVQFMVQVYSGSLNLNYLGCNGWTDRRGA